MYAAWSFPVYQTMGVNEGKLFLGYKRSNAKDAAKRTW